MARHRAPAPPPLIQRLPLPPLVDRIGAKVYLLAAIAVATPLGAALAGWPW